MDNDKLDKFAARQLAKFEEKGLVESPSKNRTPRDAMEAALLWARRKGYPLPDKPWPRWILLIGILGLFAALLPGLAVIGICWWKEENYKKQCNALLTKWIDAGRPNPDT